MVTMEDISIALGCSINTVSKALNNKPDVSPKMRQLVLATAKRMGYVPNSLAKSLVTKTSGTIGIIVPSVTIPIYSETIEAIMERAVRFNYSTFLAISAGDAVNEAVAVENLYQKRVDGLIIIPVDKKPAYYNSFKLLEPPAIYMMSDIDYEDSYFVGVDLRDCARQITQHLIDNGCKRLALLCSTRNGMMTDIENGYCDALKDNGMPVRTGDIFKPVFSLMPQDSGYEIAHMLDERIHEFDGIVLEHEFLYFGLHQLLGQHGMSCPEDLLVAASVGFGDRHSRSLSLTSIDISPSQIGYDSISLLMDLIKYKHDAAVKKIRSTPLITVRKSSKREV